MALQFGKVTGRFVAVVADSPEDSDSDPDVVPLQGVVTFTLKAPALLVPDAEPFPMTALPAPVSATLDSEGYLTLNGTRSVTLLASNGQHNPTSTTYEVKFALKHGTISVPYSTFNISVPAGETVNLTTVAPVPSSSGSPIVQGIGIKEVTADDGAFVFKMTNGTENRVGIPAFEPPATTIARCVQSVALDGSSLVFSFTDGTSERVDLSSLSDGGVVVPPDTGEVTPTPMPDTIARRFVVLGDSHSDYTSPSDAGTWWWQVAADRAGLVAVDNFAARGWDTQQAIDGAEGKPSQLTRAEQSPGDLALVMFGGNDVVHGFTVDKYEANLATIINRLKASGKRVVIVFPPPLFSLLNLEHGTQYAQMRVRARAVAAENGAYYTDAWSVMASPEGTSDPSWDSGDTVHLNDEGQRVMGMAVAAALQSFAAVTDPLGGDPRTLDWARPSQHVVAGGKIVQENMFRDDQLFRSDSVARITGGTGETVVYAETGAKPGERIRVEYPYRVTVAAPVNYQKGLADLGWIWPGGATVTRLGSTRVLVEGVRRYEAVIPAAATDNYVVGVGLVDTTDAPAEVLIGPARIAVVTPEGRPYRVVELVAPADSDE